MDKTIIDIEDTYSDGNFTIEETDCEEYYGEDAEDYRLEPPDVGKGYTIEYRDEDGYDNVTNL